ncbi:MAG TPA: efflux transporter outer membrane subunit [Sediminibacterium sp.]|nr:efflux transporter outer membrane subunit [Sediminibacterium sp.]
MKCFSIIILWVFFFLGGCKIASKYSKPTLAVPHAYQIYSDSDNTPLIKWFELYRDTALQSIIKATLENNKNLAIASVRIEEVKIEAAIIRLNQNPRLEYEVQSGRGSAGYEALKVTNETSSILYKAMGYFNWELDIWGKLRRSTAAAQAQFLASTENSNALKVSLIAEAASLYFFLRDIDNRLSITERTLGLRKENTKIISKRFEKGYIAELDKLQALQEEAIAASYIPRLKRQIAQTENALCKLMGKPSAPIQRGLSIYDQFISPTIPIGLPSQLLERRPDIKASEKLLQAQFEHIGIAEANRYPSFSLTGGLGLASPQLGTILRDGLIANGFGNTIGPIFKFGQNIKKVELEKQKTKEYQLQYEQVFLNALAEVNNALIEVKTYDEEFSLRKEQVTAARKALVLSNARYEYGYTSYLEVLTQQNSLFDAELSESELFQQKLNARVLLYKALGGGWN